MSVFKLPPSKREKPYESRYFDVAHSIAGVSVTNGNVLVTTTAGDYAGYAIITTSAGATLKVYDETTATGKLLDVLIATADTAIERDFSALPRRARIGIYVSITLGTGVEGTVFYTPRG